MKKANIFLFIFFICIFSAHSQCAMCRAVAESSQNTGSGIANGLNAGILYLMVFPYILLLFALISIYFREKQTN